MFVVAVVGGERNLVMLNTIVLPAGAEVANAFPNDILLPNKSQLNTDFRTLPDTLLHVTLAKGSGEYAEEIE